LIAATDAVEIIGAMRERLEVGVGLTDFPSVETRAPDGQTGHHAIENSRFGVIDAVGG